MTAVVIGSTGMVGNQLIAQLLNSDIYSQVVSLVRKPTAHPHPKLIEHVVDFERIADVSDFIKGDVLFSCMGTTLATAGSKAAQYTVDFTYQYQVAQLGALNGIKHYVLVSSAGAHPKAASFYLRMKGQLDEAVMKLPFSSITILRPGQLDGNRVQSRPMEKLALYMMHGLNKIGLLKKYRPIQAHQVAQAMIKVVENHLTGIFTLDEIFKIT